MYLSGVLIWVLKWVVPSDDGSSGSKSSDMIKAVQFFTIGTNK